VSVRDVMAAAIWLYEREIAGAPLPHPSWETFKANDPETASIYETHAASVDTALRAAGYAVVPVGQTCPFDRIDHGGLAPEDPCPVCGDIGTPATDDQPSRCISGQARAMIAAAQEPGP